MDKNEGKIKEQSKKQVHIKSIWNVIKKIMKSKGDYILCFLFSFIIVTIIYIMKKVLPFGVNSLLDSDFFYQYDVMLAEIRDRILSHSSLIYSFRSGLGLPLYRNFFNYLASPINIISLFVKRDEFMMSFSFIIGIKAIISTFTMYYYLKKRFYDREKSEEPKINKFIYISLALLYAFSGYFSSYYINIMWLDGMMLLPLMALSIDELIIDNKWRKYCIVLALIIFTNYYIAYMLCLFACVYFVYSFIVNTKFSKKEIKTTFIRFFRTGILFASVSILAAAMCMTSIYLMKNTIASLDATTTNEEFPTEFGYEMIVRDVLLANFNGARSNLYYSDDAHIPHISVGVLCIALLIWFILNGKISIKEKIVSIIILGLYFAAFFVPQIDFVIHAFHEPNDYPFRYAFVYSFIFIMLAGRALKQIKNIGYARILLAFGLILAFLLKFGKEEVAVLNQEVLIMNIVFLSLYVIIILFGKFFNFNRIIVAIMILITPVELVLMYRNKWDITQDATNFKDRYNNYRAQVQYIGNIDEEKFYRMDKPDYLSLNDGCWEEYNGLTIFSSMAYNTLSEFMYKLGLPGNDCDSYIYNDTTPFINLLLDIKYVMGDFELDNSKYFDTIKDDKENNIFKFKNSVGLGFGVNDDVLQLDYEDKSPFQVQDELAKLMSGTSKELFSNIKYQKKEVSTDDGRVVCEYTFENPNKDVYFYPSEYDIDFFKIGSKLYSKNFDESSYQEYEYLYPQISGCEQVGYGDGGIIKIQPKKKEVKIVIVYTTPNYLEETQICTFNDDVFTDFYNTVKEEKLIVTKFEDDVIEGKINLKDGKLVFTSIPYDIGWNVYVDGEKYESYAFADSFLCFYPGPGEHTIRLEYRLPKMGLAVVGNVLAIILFILLCVDGKSKRNKVENEEIKQ